MPIVVLGEVSIFILLCMRVRSDIRIKYPEGQIGCRFKGNGNAFRVDCLTLWKIACGRDFDLSFFVLWNERLLKNSSKFIASPRARASILFPRFPYPATSALRIAVGLRL
jgi:hypothetical protein